VSLEKKAAELLLLEAIAAVDKSTFHGGRFDGWQRKGGVHNGPEISRRVRVYIVDMQKALAHYEEALAFYEAAKP